MRPRNLSIAVALGVTAAAGHARAQSVEYTPELDPDRFVLTSDPTSVALTESARPLPWGDFALGMALRAGGAPLQLCVRQPDGTCSTEGDLLAPRVGVDLVGAYGFGRLGVHLQLPVILHQDTDFAAPSSSSDELAVAGIADLRAGAKLLLLESGGVAVGWDLTGTVPTGGSDFTGDGGTTIENRLIVEHRSGALGIAAQLGHAWRQEPARIANLYVDDEVLWSVGAEYAFNPTISAGIAAFGRIGLMGDPDRMDDSPSVEERPAEALASVRWFASPGLAVEAAAGTGLDSGYGAPDFRALAGLRWSHHRPPPKPNLDRDRDGILNDEDRCPDDPEDRDAFEDEDGCPELDNDKDGILDDKDACPLVPEDLDQFEDNDGCPDPDNDKDGILDEQDACPLVPEDLDGFEDTDGCPDPDNDKDGILDNQDKCPLVPEDADGFEDGDGCPEPDNDKDGLLDNVDKCPNDPEVYNGIDDTDGCPDTGGAQATVTEKAIVISDAIYFDTNKATIKSKSHALLDAIATLLEIHGSLRIRIEGHTDDRGTAEWNMSLSQRRAEAVMDYLIGKGVDAGRLEAAGFGETQPKIEGTSTKARDANRRVEFNIIKPAEATPAPKP